MHTSIGSKKTIAGYTPLGTGGLLLIDMGNASSTAKWVPAIRKLDENSGSPLKTMA